MSTTGNNSAGTPPNAAGAPGASGLEKQYQPANHEGRIRSRWESSGAFHADPAKVVSGQKKPYSIVIPPPNVTAALHLGHALNNTLQDVLIRSHRMMGFEALWMPGTDHAGIATQAVVEKRVSKEEGKRRKDFTREAFVAKIQAFKDEYEATITGQLKAMGCSCDWSRQRFTMDDVCARAVREAFFRLFKDGLIYRGKRLVNWDPALQTAVADDECYDEEIDGAFYYLRYPLVHKYGQETERERAGGQLPPDDAVPVTWNELTRRGYPGAANHPQEEQAWVTVATTRPETYLGDTAVAVSPHDPRAKALHGLHVELPLVGRVIPIVTDDYVVLPEAIAKQLGRDEEAEDPKAKFATGFLKVTPAHDPNDWELGIRHHLAAINVMAPDATISDKHGWTDVGDSHIFVGKKREEARKLVVKEFEARGLLESQKPYRHSVKHSDRSKAIVEPYLSDQWYVKVTDPRLAASANNALVPDQRTSGGAAEGPRATHSHASGSHSHVNDSPARASDSPTRANDSPTHANTAHSHVNAAQSHAGESPTHAGESPTHARGTPAQAGVSLAGAAGSPSPRGTSGGHAAGDGSLTFHPARYAKTYEQWHDGIRDWCISRQLWWGHRIPVWSAGVLVHSGDDFALFNQQTELWEKQGRIEIKVWLASTGSELTRASEAEENALSRGDVEAAKDAHRPFHSRFICVRDEHDREIIDRLEQYGFQRDPDVLDTWFSSALWPISTMGWPDPSAAPAGPEFAGMLEAFNPTSVLCTAREIITLWVSRMVMFNRYFMGNGQGKGPLPFNDVFIHAMIQDGQGRKMSKSLGNGVDPLDIIESHGADAMRFTLVQMTTQTQDVRMPVQKDSKSGKNTSPKFDQGRNFCNKLWNAARFTIQMLEPHQGSDASAAPIDPSTLSLVDKWMLSRLARTVREVEQAIANYEFSSYGTAMYDLVWRDFCDWYLESIKSTVESDPQQRAVLLHVLGAICRLLHPIMPFVTEAIWEKVAVLVTAPLDGLESCAPLNGETMLAVAKWPSAAELLVNAVAEQIMTENQVPAAEFRELRSAANFPPKQVVPAIIRPTAITSNTFSGYPVTTREPATATNWLQPGGSPATPFQANTPPPAGILPAFLNAETNRVFLTASGISNITTGEPPAGSLAAQVCGYTLYIPPSHLPSGSKVDEKERLLRLIAEKEKSIGVLQGRLANPGYADRAPAAMVQQTRDQLKAAQDEVEALKGQLAGMN